MGAADISGINKLFPQGQTAAAGTSAQTKDARADFTQVMNRMNGWAGGGMPAQNQADGFGARQQTAGAADTYDRYQYKENGIREKETPVREMDDRITSKLEKYAEDVKEVLKEELGVSEEQIEEAMETLGLTFADLMDPGKLAGLAAELTGSSEISDLLCSGEFMAVMQEAGALGTELLNELGMTMEELSALVEAQKVTEPEENGFDAVLSAETVDTVPEQKTDDASEIQTQTAAKETGTDRMAVRSEEPSEKSTVSEPEEDIVQRKDAMPENETRQSGEKENAPEGQDRSPVRTQDHSRPAGHVNEAAFGQNPTEAVHLQNPEAATGMTEQVDVADIIRQIAEFTRVSVGNDVTTLQMQLNPEHLGKLYLELTAREGNVSARIMAQNETVKEALEAQIVELRQSMNEAGVKVDAIEVTIASHEFERNLEQNAQRDERQAQEQEKAAKRTRRIRLDDLGELAGVMSEEESLVVQMMADQGNSVDFTA